MKTLLPRFRPFTVWPVKSTRERKAGSFQVEYTRAIDDIIRELLHLDAWDVVISTNHAASEIRLDGWPRASAKKPLHPGVSLFFKSKVGPLAFHCDTYSTWQANLRAVGLTLEALRAVDRHSATTNGAQYKGYAALPPPEPGQSGQTADQAREGTKPRDTTNRPSTDPRDAAARLLLATGGFEISEKNIRIMLKDAEQRKGIWRKAVNAAHPDRNGGEGHERFLAVQAAYELLSG